MSSKGDAQKFRSKASVMAVVIARTLEGKGWEEIAAEHDCAVRTLWNLRQREIWKECAEEVTAEIRAEIGPLVHQSMLEVLTGTNHIARVNAAKLMLDRIEGVQEQKVEVNVRSELANLTNEELAELASGTLPASLNKQREWDE